MKVRLKENHYISIYNFPEKSILELVWKPTSADIAEEEYKRLVSHWADTVENFHPKSILVDTREHYVAIVPELQLWFVEEIFPKYEASGMEKFAFIMSPDFFSQLSIEQTMEEAPNVSFITKYFPNYEEAFTWICS